MSVTSVAGAPPRAAHLPGTTGIWTFLFIDMLVFLTIFLVFLTERLRLPDVYAQAQHMLNGLLGLVNTIVLLTSSWLMVGAVEAFRKGHVASTRARLLLVMLCGLAFCAGKGFEYHEKYEAGISVVSNSFFSFYFFLTGVHLLHVVGGLVFMGALRSRLGGDEGRMPQVAAIENVGLFWHLVDVLWIYIFSLVYLVGLR